MLFCGAQSTGAACGLSWSREANNMGHVGGGTVEMLEHPVRSLALRAGENVRDADKDAVAEARWQLDRRFVGIALPVGPGHVKQSCPICAFTQVYSTLRSWKGLACNQPLRRAITTHPARPCEAFAQLLTEPLATVVDTACCGRLGVAALGGKRNREKSLP